MGAFSDQIGAWAAKTQKRTEAVYQRSVELMGEEMARTKPEGGRVPIDTGNLSRSLLASTEGMPKTSDKVPPGSNVGLVAATLRLDQPVWLGYTAVYSRVANYGFVGADKLGRVYNQAGNYFVEGAIMKWPELVKKAVEEIKGSQ